MKKYIVFLVVNCVFYVLSTLVPCDTARADSVGPRYLRTCTYDAQGNATSYTCGYDVTEDCTIDNC
jgi:hypothetical protein